MAKVVKGSTRRGQDLIIMGERWAGNTLSQCYDNWSHAKQKAFDWCWEKYVHTENSSAFGICSYNTFGFTVSWLGLYEGENALFIETKDNSYIVLLDK